MSGTSVEMERQVSICSEGVHTFKIEKSEEKMGAQGPYWNFQMRCIDEGTDKGQSLWAMISLTPQARFKLDQFLDAVDAPKKGKAEHEDFVGKTLRVKVTWETYQGTTRAKPESFIAPGANVTSTTSKAQKPPTAGDAQKEPSIPSDATTGFKSPF